MRTGERSVSISRIEERVAGGREQSSRQGGGEREEGTGRRIAGRMSFCDHTVKGGPSHLLVCLCPIHAHPTAGDRAQIAMRTHALDSLSPPRRPAQTAAASQNRADGSLCE